MSSSSQCSQKKKKKKKTEEHIEESTGQLDLVDMKDRDLSLQLVIRAHENPRWADEVPGPLEVFKENMNPITIEK